MARRVLIVSYYFPPHPSVASLRLRGLATYLAEFGWEPVVLTASHPQATGEEPCRVIRARDPGELSVLLKQKLGLSAGRSFQEQLGVPTALRERRRPLVKRVFLRLKGWVVYPDDMRPWGKHALEAGLELLRGERFDAILSSSGPATVNLVAARLQRAAGIPWLGDFRDLWTQKHDYGFGRARRHVERRLERKTLAGVHALSTVSGPLADQLGALHGRRVAVIPNGFDPEEANQAGEPAPGFHVLYTGGLYNGAMDPAPFLKVVARVRAELPELRVDFYGDAPGWLASEVLRLGLSSVVTLHGRRPRAEIVELQRKARVLLLFGWRDRTQRGITTGKVFEYLAAGRPILAADCVADDVIGALLEETGAGWSCENEAELEQRVRLAYADYAESGDVRWTPDSQAIERYSHLSMARSFAAELDQLVGGSAS